ncbi:MAG: hypothetical protein WCB27_16190 [Thermoguttaceae bacterium]
MLHPTQSLDDRLLTMILAAQPIIQALSVREGELGADIRQGRLCPLDLAIRGLTLTRFPRQTLGTRHDLPTLQDLQQAFEVSLQQFLAGCSLTIGGTIVPLNYGRIELPVRRGAVRDIIVHLRVRPAQLEDYQALKTG